VSAPTRISQRRATVAGNGKKYANRYHFYFLFDGDRIAQVREYNDVNLVREIFFA